jgi:hypothetical protein
MTDLLLKRAAASPGEVYDVICEERIAGRIMLSARHHSLYSLCASFWRTRGSVFARKVEDV